MWCDILNNPKQGAPSIQDCSHLMNVPVDYDDKVERKANHPTLLVIKQDDEIKVTPLFGIYQRLIQVWCAGVCWRVASRSPDGTRHESHDENIFGEQPRKTLVTKDLPSDLLNDENKKVSDKRSY